MLLCYSCCFHSLIVFMFNFPIFVCFRKKLNLISGRNFLGMEILAMIFLQILKYCRNFLKLLCIRNIIIFFQKCDSIPSITRSNLKIFLFGGDDKYYLTFLVLFSMIAWYKKISILIMREKKLICQVLDFKFLIPRKDSC